MTSQDTVGQSRADLIVMSLAVSTYFSSNHTATANNLQRATRNEAVNCGLSFGRIVRGVRVQTLAVS